MTNPWLCKEVEQSKEIIEDQSDSNLESNKNHLQFEDNFTSCTTGKSVQVNSSSIQSTIIPLDDTDSYLQGLERKLAKIKKTNLVKAISEKREDCMRTLLTTEDTVRDHLLELDTPVSNSELYRHLQPIHPLTVGETVHIVKHDQLDQNSGSTAPDLLETESTQ